MKHAALPRRVITGLVTTFLALIVLLPLSAVAARSSDQSWPQLRATLTNPQAVAAFELTFGAALLVALIAAVMGTLIAWVLVRDQFPGKRLVNMVIDLPFALPTIVAGLALLTLYGPKGIPHANIAFTRTSIVAALLFVTLPFVVRAVQPVLLELDRSMEEAASSLGATPFVTFRRIVLPNLLPAILTGTALSFAKAIGEFGSVVLISGNIPRHTEVASVYVFAQIESDNPAGAAAVSCVLLALALMVLVGIGFLQRRTGRGIH